MDGALTSRPICACSSSGALLRRPVRERWRGRSRLKRRRRPKQSAVLSVMFLPLVQPTVGRLTSVAVLKTSRSRSSSTVRPAPPRSSALGRKDMARIQKRRLSPMSESVAYARCHGARGRDILSVVRLAERVPPSPADAVNGKTGMTTVRLSS